MWTKNLSTLKILVLGFLANVLGLLTLILIVYLGLATFALFFTMLNELTRAGVTGTPLSANGSALELIGGSLADSAQNALKGLWDARLGFLIFGVLGTFTAWVHQIGLVVDKKRAWLGSFMGMLVIMTVSIITWTFVQREEVVLWIAETPELYRWRDLFLGSYTTDVGVSLIVALVITPPIWTVWRWWYVRLMTWLTPSTLAPEPTTPTRGTALEEHQAYAARLHELKRETLSAESYPGQRKATLAEIISVTEPPSREETGQGGKLIEPLATLFVLCVTLLLLANNYHDQVAMRLQHGDAFVDVTTRPHQEFVVRIEPGAQKIRVANVKGEGIVSLYLSPTADYREAVESVEDWSFEWRLDESLYVDVPVAGLEPGDYHLHVVQESGWGYFQYTLAHGGGRLSHLSALVTGFLLACSLVVGLTLVFLGVVRSRSAPT
jgi:hypothetical protein